jgi:hypothetical protein
MTPYRWKFGRVLGVLALLGMLGLGAAPARAEGVLEAIEADETLVYVHDAKKVEVRARIRDASTEEGASKWNLVQVGQDGQFVRYIGILYYSRKRQAFFRKLELQEREPGQRYFEIVPDSELEPFVVKQRPRLVIDVEARPSILDIVRGALKKLVGQLPPLVPVVHASEVGLSPAKAHECLQKIESGWMNVAENGVAAGTRVIRGARSGGGIFSARQTTVEYSIEQVAEQLWNPVNLKNPRNTRLKIEEIASEKPGHRAKKVEVNVRPFVFISVDWQELWERQDSAGGHEIRIGYRKGGGEEKLKHFCGWMAMRRLGPSKTEITLYEEIDSPHRTLDDMAKGQRGTIETLLKNLKR